MGKRVISVAILLGAVIFISVWASGMLKGILPDGPDTDPPIDDPPPGGDGIAEVSGTIYDSVTGQPLTLVLVSCGQLQSYTGAGSEYSLEVDLANPMGCGAIIKADVSSAYYLGTVIVELDDLVPVVADIYVDPR